MRQSATEKYLGKVFPSKVGDFLVRKYDSVINKWEIEFLDTGYVSNICVGQILLGSVKDYRKPTVCGVGIVGDIGFCPQRDKDLYNIWKSLIARCYSKTYHNLQCYHNVCVSDNFKHFQKFCNWATHQRGFNKKGWHLDKDLLSKESKIYSEETCCFIPQDINLLIRYPYRKGRDLPRGVVKTKTNNFTARLSTSGGVKRHIGTYSTVEEAFTKYKEAKEAYVRSIADKWKDQIDPRAYEALMAWEINIDD